MVQSVGTAWDGVVKGSGRTERDEPPFINLDRLLNPGFDETRPGAYIHVCHSATVTRTRTLCTPVLVSC